jgi:reactive chlorine resistance protein C
MENAAVPLDLPGWKLQKAGGFVLRYGLVLILLWIGGLKFTEYEAKGIEPLVANSPLLAWAYHALGTKGISRLLGVSEILFGLLILMRPVFPKLSAVGGLAAIVMFLTTLSLLFSTPGVIAPGYSFPVLSADTGQFLIKDLILLGAAIWTAGEATTASGN